MTTISTDLLSPVFHISIPPYKFGKGGIDYVVARGLYRYGPLEPIDHEVINEYVFYIRPKNDDSLRKYVDLLCNLIVNGTMGYSCKLPFYGFERYFRVKLRLTPVEVVVSNPNDPEEVSQALRDIIRAHRHRIIVPIIIVPPHPRKLETNHYIHIKASLFAERIYVSQIIRQDTVNDPERLCGSLLPISIQLYSKFGGIPYAIARSIGSIHGKALLVGVGLTRVIRGDVYRVEDQDLAMQEQYMGITTIFASDGTFKYVDARLSKLDKQVLSETLKESIIDAIRELRALGFLSPDEIENLWVIVHYSGKEISGKEEEAIEQACYIVSRDMKLHVEPAIVKVISDNIYRVFDERVNMYPVIGTSITLIEGNLYILNTLGYNPISGKPLRREMPRSVLISLKKYSDPIIIKELLFSVLALARMNFAGAQLMYRLPATVAYSRKAANLLARIMILSKVKEVPISFNELPKDKPWFL